MEKENPGPGLGRGLVHGCADVREGQWAKFFFLSLGVISRPGPGQLGARGALLCKKWSWADLVFWTSLRQ
jgi:hypothetical protein